MLGLLDHVDSETKALLGKQVIEVDEMIEKSERMRRYGPEILRKMRDEAIWELYKDKRLGKNQLEVFVDLSFTFMERAGQGWYREDLVSPHNRVEIAKMVQQIRGEINAKEEKKVRDRDTVERKAEPTTFGGKEASHFSSGVQMQTQIPLSEPFDGKDISFDQQSPNALNPTVSKDPFSLPLTLGSELDANPPPGFPPGSPLPPIPSSCFLTPDSQSQSSPADPFTPHRQSRTYTQLAAPSDDGSENILDMTAEQHEAIKQGALKSFHECNGPAPLRGRISLNASQSSFSTPLDHIGSPSLPQSQLQNNTQPAAPSDDGSENILDMTAEQHAAIKEGALNSLNDFDSPAPLIGGSSLNTSQYIFATPQNQTGSSQPPHSQSNTQQVAPSDQGSENILDMTAEQHAAIKEGALNSLNDFDSPAPLLGGPSLNASQNGFATPENQIGSSPPIPAQSQFISPDEFQQMLDDIGYQQYFQDVPMNGANGYLPPLSEQPELITPAQFRQMLDDIGCEQYFEDVPMSDSDMTDDSMQGLISTNGGYDEMNTSSFQHFEPNTPWTQDPSQSPIRAPSETLTEFEAACTTLHDNPGPFAEIPGFGGSEASQDEDASET